MEFEICEECEAQIDSDLADLANYQHAIYCSLYPDTIDASEFSWASAFRIASHGARP